MLITAVVWGYRMRPTSAPCTSVTFVITDKAERLYVTETELQQLLLGEDMYPVGRVLDAGVLHSIEQTVKRHPMVRTAECYLTPRNEVRVRLTQRVPLLRVHTPAETYLVDTDRKVMQLRAVVRDSVPVVTGAVSVQAATHELAHWAEWLHENTYWKTKIHHLQMQNPRMAYIYLREENAPRVVLGSMHGYARKLDKLRTFFDHSEEAMQDKHYTELDIRFRGQVIGRN